MTSIISALLRKDSTQVMRGNMYGALLNYLRYTTRPLVITRTDAAPHHTRTLHQEEVYRYGLPVGGPSSSRRQWTELETGNAAILANFGDRLIETVSTDATEVIRRYPSIPRSSLSLRSRQVRCGED